MPNKRAIKRYENYFWHFLSSLVRLLILLSPVPFHNIQIPVYIGNALFSLCFFKQGLEDYNHYVAVIEWDPEELILYCIVEVNKFTTAFLCWNLKPSFWIFLGHTRFVKSRVS